MTIAPYVSPDVRVPFAPRGPLSAAVLSRLTTDTANVPLRDLARGVAAVSVDPVRDDDVQLALFCLYGAFYGAVDAFRAEAEWDVELIEVRSILEAVFEARLRSEVETTELPEATQDAVGRALFALTAAEGGPSLSRFVAKKATRAQIDEFFIQRSVYTLREADPHSWAIPRLRGRAKAALVEIQSDEYGGGRPDRVHAEVFAKAMRGVGLDTAYGAYVDSVPAVILASQNVMSMFGLNRRLLGAVVGHLAAFEMTSSIPNRMYAEGMRRLGFGDDVTDYFDEHVEADAVHEQIAGFDMAGALAEDRPDLLPDIMFGAAACLAVDGWGGAHIHEAWTHGRSSLRDGARP